MPKTPPTIVAPLPTDPRVMSLAKSVSLTRREAFAAAAEAWAWMAVMAVDDIVVNTAVDSLDGLVDVPGFGTAMLQAGLVGVVNDGLVLPVELRRRERDQRRERAAAAAEDQDDKAERERKQARVRQRRRRRDKALEKTNAKTASPPPTADTRVKWTPRRLGTVDGHDVMLFYSPKTEAWFYCLKDASPHEWTASVADQQNPSFAEALAGLHSTMKREAGKGLGSGDTFRPSLKAMVTAAERYRDERASAAADDARRDEGNKALAEASAEDQDDIDHEPAERDCHAPVTVPERDTVTVTVMSRSESVTSPPKSCDEGDFGGVTCHAPVTVPAPSSSNSLSASGNEDKENTTTTSVVTPRKRDHEDDILERFVPRKDPVVGELERKRQEVAARFAAALGVTVESVIQQWRSKPDTLRARVEAAGIDPNTGLPVNAEGAHEPAAARDDIGVTTEPIDQDRPAAGNVGARGDGEFACSHLDIHDALRGLGIPSPARQALPAEDNAFEDERRRTMDQLLKQGA